MRNTRFIFIEGIMGAGKSTTAWFLTWERVGGISGELESC